MGKNSALGITSSRPTIAFPLGLAILVLVLVCITGFFACCYHWNKLRYLLCSSASATHLDDQSSDDYSAHISAFKIIQAQKQKHGESLTILMPGDEVPKFVALPTPHRCTLQL